MAHRLAHQRIELIVTVAALLLGIVLGAGAVAIVHLADREPPAQVTAAPVSTTVPAEVPAPRRAEPVIDRTALEPMVVRTQVADRLALVTPVAATPTQQPAAPSPVVAPAAASASPQRV